MAKVNNKKRSIAQWTGVILALGASPLMFAISMILGPSIGGDGGWGVILALGASPLMFAISMILGPSIGGDGGWGVILGILFLCLGIYLFALLISKITYFIIK